MPAGMILQAMVLLSLFLQSLSGMDTTCTVSHDDDRTTYYILNVPFDVKPNLFKFSWSNETNHVLANHVNKMELVLNSSFNTLVTSHCFENIVCEGHVISKGIPLDYTANCTTTCPPKAVTEDKGIPSSWITAVVAAVVIFLILAGFLCYSYRIQRRHCCGQTGCFYASVEMENHDQVTVPMEERNG